MSVHWNSINSYTATLSSIGERQQEILNVLEDRSMTDRQIAEALGYSDLNAVRPRITELVQADVLEENGVVTCSTTGRSVRLVRKAFVEYPEMQPEEEEEGQVSIPDTFTSPIGRVITVRSSELGLGVVFRADDGDYLYFSNRDVDGLIDRLLQLTEEEEGE